VNAAEWDAEADSSTSLYYLIYKRKVQRTKSGRRKLRLFGVACGRRVESLVGDPKLLALLPAAEACADGTITAKALAAMRPEYPPMWSLNAIPSDSEQRGELFAQYRQGVLAAGVLWDCASPEASSPDGFHIQAAFALGPDRYDAELAVQADFLRDIFGNPFRPVTLNKSWRTTDAVGVARSVYDSRDFSPMPILADALEDAGCDNAEVLAHCRGDGPHARGCWVVDWVLNKA
jgi:hypothetical protein